MKTSLFLSWEILIPHVVKLCCYVVKLINLLNYENHTPKNTFINMMFSNILQPSVLHPTRISDTSSTIIDKSFGNSAPDSKIHSGNVLSLISDHLPQFCIIYDCKFECKAPLYLSYDYSHFDANELLADYAKIDTSFIADQNINLDGKFDKFLLSLHCLIDKHCPQKKLTKKKLKLKNRPWIKLRIQKKMKIRDRLFQKFKSTKSTTDLKAYKQFRNRVVNELRESKKNYYHQFFEDNKNNMKMLWNGIKNIVSLKTNNLDTISDLMNKEGSQIYDPGKMANEFNHFFTNAANDITKTIPRIPKSPLSYLVNPNLNAFFISLALLVKYLLLFRP